MRPVPSGYAVSVTTELAGGLSLGESVSVNGVCLTVTHATAETMQADIGPETVRRTTLGGLVPGRLVNLERAMRADARVGGHFVQGHVDGTGEIRAIREDGDARWITVGFPEELAPLLVSKGSVAVDGISLTVASLRMGEFDVMIVPFTWSHTHLPQVRVGELVNLECDMIGKYVARTVEVHRAAQQGRETAGKEPTS